MKDGRVAEYDSPHNLLSDTKSLFYSMAATSGDLSLICSAAAVEKSKFEYN